MTDPIRKIMVYVDGSEASMAAARYAVVLAGTLEAELVALTVVNTRALADLVKAHIFLVSEQEDYFRDLNADAERYLNYARELARKKGVAATTEVASGAVSLEIRNKAVQLGVDLLVLGELPQAQSRRDELYDEVDRAMRSVPCSVLIAKDEDRIWDLYEAYRQGR